MLNDFLIFVAPFLVIGAAIAVTFWAVLRDDSASEQ